MSVRVAATVARQNFTLTTDVEFATGEVTAVMGPNGAGKSTLLRVIAGLQAIDRGEVTINGKLVDDGRRVLTSPADRHVGLVFQDYALFAHLSVLENVAFGPRSRGIAASAARQGALGLLERLGIADLAARRPTAISGGQAQRVALARALATNPGVLLLDEPMAALDAEARVSVRAELQALLQEFTGVTIMVSHEPRDALALATRVIVLEHGCVTQDATPKVLAAAPATPYISALMRETS
jgi:molybdate transport system ATP-binding protein